MTRNDRHKKAVRAYAAATGRSYMDAAAALARTTKRRPVVLAEDLRTDLMAAMRAWGWPVNFTTDFYEFLCFEVGPADLMVSRHGTPRGGKTEKGSQVDRTVHPDDGDEYDLTAPLRLTMDAPVVPDYVHGLNRQTGVFETECPASSPIAKIVAYIDQTLTAARSHDMADIPSRTRCDICGDYYPKKELLAPTSTSLLVCPCCVFDGEIVGPHLVAFAPKLSRLLRDRLSAPAGWAAVYILLR